MSELILCANCNKPWRDHIGAGFCPIPYPKYTMWKDALSMPTVCSDPDCETCAEGRRIDEDYAQHYPAVKVPVVNAGGGDKRLQYLSSSRQVLLLR